MSRACWLVLCALVMLLFAHEIILDKQGGVKLLCYTADGTRKFVTLKGVNPYKSYAVGTEAEVKAFLDAHRIKFSGLRSFRKKIVRRARHDDEPFKNIVEIVFPDFFAQFNLSKVVSQSSLEFFDVRSDPNICALLQIRKNVKLGGWIEVSKQDLHFRDIVISDSRNSPPLWVNCFDIETTSLVPTVPHAQVIMIGSCEGFIHGKTWQKETVWVTRAPRFDAPDWFKERFGHVELRFFQEQRDTILDWQQQMRKAAIICGYNSQNFDMPYLWHQLYESECLFGVTDEPCRLFQRNQSSRQKGTDEFMSVDTPGILHIDMMVVAKQQLKLPTYSLNAVSKKCLGTTKEDVSWKQIVPYFESEDPEKFWKLVAYQVMDARLCWDLLQNRGAYNFVSGFTKIVPVPPSYIFGRGQLCKVWSVVKEFVSVDQEFSEWFIGEPAKNEKKDESFTFSGGCVLNPIPGVYTPDSKLGVLDFMSLYPSIVVAFNLSFETVVDSQADVEPMVASGSEIAAFEIGEGDKAFFLQKPKGILPAVIEMLLENRREAKKNLKACKEGSSDYQFFNARQLAIKVVANSIYGFCGATIAPIFEPLVARTITSIGRTMIEASRDRLQDCELFTPSQRCKVVYGDTDSVMPLLQQFGGDQQVLKKYLEWISDRYTQMHAKPHVLEAEGMTLTAIFVKKKTYAYLNLLEGNSLTKKGLETVKRDYPPCVSKMFDKLWDTMLTEGSVEKVVSLAKQLLADFMTQGSIPKEEFAISVKYNRTDQKPPHALLAERTHKTDPEVAPRLGERFEYIVCYHENPAAPLHEKMHIKQRVLESSHLLPDLDYYLESKVINSLERLFTALEIPHMVSHVLPSYQKDIMFHK